VHAFARSLDRWELQRRQEHTANALAARDGWKVVAIDEIPRHEPAFNPLSEQFEPWGKSAESLRDLLVAAARAASPCLEREVESALAAGGASILEGERLHPAVVASWCFEECERRAVPVVRSQPWDTLFAPTP
jgi:hypothetical protein